MDTRETSNAVGIPLAPGNRDRQPIYPDPASKQNAPLLSRLRERRFTKRKLLAWITAIALLIFAEPMVPTFVLGGVIVGLGLAMRIWTFGHLRKNLWLVVTGPYAHSRNPAYVGSGLVMTGLFIAAGNPYSVQGLGVWAIGIAALFVFFVFYMPRKYRREYANLRQLFGDDAVARHAAHVPDFFPRLTPWRSGDGQRFSWRCVLANHELVWPLAGALALAVIGLGSI